MSRTTPRLRRLTACALALALAGPARAQDTPPPLQLPSLLTLDEALNVFRARGFDLLIADAQVASAHGDVAIAHAFANPSVSYTYSHVFNYDPATVCPVMLPGDNPGQCSPNVHNLTLGDNNAVMDAISGKRGLRIDIAEAALAASKMSRIDAERTLSFSVKQQYFLAVQARALRDFAVEVQASATRTADLNRLRYQAGAINEADLAKVVTTKLEADQAVDQAEQTLRTAKVQLAFLLGVRGRVPDYQIEADLLKFRVPPGLEKESPDAMIDEARHTRADLRAALAQVARATASVSQAKRARFPDLGLQVGFAMAGSGGPTTSANTTPPTLSVGISGNLPIFYQQQGEITKAEADLRTQRLTAAKLEAQLIADVESAWNAYTQSRKLVERMESQLLGQAKLARDLVAIQYQKGAASLLEFLDAQRTYIATNEEYFQDLTNYWTAVFQLEEAVGRELR